jgi:uncharacterized protein (TIGR03663 family)
MFTPSVAMRRTIPPRAAAFKPRLPVGLMPAAPRGYPIPVPARLLTSRLPEIAILCAAVLLRTWLLEIKPAHFDEGINGWFADQMLATGYYRYDPTNYHGPLHFYAVFLSQTLFGRSEWALRLPIVIVSILCVAALFRLRKFFGRPACLLAALAMSLSPAYVFYGRYSIHESWQVLFSILLLEGILGLWKTGTRRFLFTTAAALTGLVLTKETYILHAGCLALAATTLFLWQKILPSRPAVPIARQLWTRDDAILAGGLASLAIVFFYSGTFFDFRQLTGLYETFAAWVKTGTESGGHEKTAYDLIGPLNYYWLYLMARYEWPALAGFLACLRYAAPSPALIRLTAIWACGTLLAYSIIAYKTPWCIISMLWPFYLVLGALLAEAASRLDRRAIWLAAAPLLAFSLYACIRLNFFVFTDDSEPYVYVQTYEDIRDFTGPVLEAARQDPAGFQMEGTIALDSYYPLPWMLGDFTRIGYFSKENPPARWDADFIVVDSASAAETEKKLTRPYYKIPFRLRSGQEECTAYLAADRFQKILKREPDITPAPAPIPAPAPAP